MLRLLSTISLLALGTGSFTPVLAQSDYPTRTVRIVVPFAPGGATDTSARILASSLEKQLRQPFIIENRPGAFTLVGIEAVARSTPDGYTLLFSSNNVANQQPVVKAWTVRIDRDIVPIAMLSRSGISLIVNPQLPIRNLRELIAYGKANPGKLNQGLAATSPPEVDEIMARNGVQVVQVPYKGGPVMIQAVVAGDAHFSTGSPQDVVGLAQQGRVRPIVYLEKERHPMLPDVPTVAESGVGLEDFDAAIWFCLLGPAGLPEGLAARLNASVQTALRDAEIIGLLSKQGMRPWPLGIAETRARVLAEVKATEDRVARGIIKPQ